MDETVKCENCRFWSSHDDGYGECRRRAPVLCAEEDYVWAVTSNLDWCGEFVVAPDSAEELETQKNSKRV